MIEGSGGRLGALAFETTALIEELRRSVVQVISGRGQGSGVIWQDDGLIITNHHVVPQSLAEVELEDGRRFRATAIARDEGNDLVLLRIGVQGLPAARIGSAARLRVGEMVMAIGNPMGAPGRATLGILSAAGEAPTAGQKRQPLLQADLALAPGNSGGPIADMEGRVVGIATMILRPGIALAVSSETVGEFIALALSEAA